MKGLILVAVGLLCLQCAVSSQSEKDWLIKSSGYMAQLVEINQNQIALENGLVRRIFLIKDNGATIAIDNIMTGQSVLRGVKPKGRWSRSRLDFSCKS